MCVCIEEGGGFFSDALPQWHIATQMHLSFPLLVCSNFCWSWGCLRCSALTILPRTRLLCVVSLAACVILYNLLATNQDLELGSSLFYILSIRRVFVSR